MNIAVIRGGPTAEHAISLLSGQTCIDALKTVNNIFDVVIDESLEFWVINSKEYQPAKALSILKNECDVALPMLHGAFGEDGTIQGALQACSIAYVGSGVQASALACDKFASGLVFQQHTGFNMPEFIFLQKIDIVRHQDPIQRLGFPIVCKPANGGSSVDTFLANSFDELTEKLAGTSAQAFIIQRVVTGTEVTCGVVVLESDLTALEVIEIIPAGGTFFDYDAKYSGQSQEILPARISPELATQVQDSALEAHKLLGCRDISRSDFIIDSSNKIWILEVNTMPGMTSESLVPKEISFANLDLAEVLQNMCERAVERRA